MEKQVGQLYVELRADINRLKKEIKGLNSKIGNQAKNSGKEIGKQISAGITEGLGKLASIYLAFEGVKKSLDLAGTFEQNRVAFTTLLGDATKAKQMLQDLVDFAKNTPFELLGLQDTAKQLLGMGFEARQIIPTLKVLGDSISAVGGGQEELQRVVRALSQIKAKGKLSAEEMMQLAETGLPVYDILREKLNLTAKEMGNLGNAGIKAGDAIGAIIEGLNEKYSGMMEAQSKTFKGMLSNLQDSVDVFMKNIGESILPQIKNLLSNVLNFFSKWGSYLAKQIGETFKLLYNTIGETLNALGDGFKNFLSFFESKNQKTIQKIGLNWQSLFFYFRTGFKAIVAVIKIAVSGITALLGNIVLAGKGVYDGVVGSFKLIGKAGIAVFKTMKIGVIKIFENLVNKISGAFNWIIEKYNYLGKKVGLGIKTLGKVNWTAGKDIKDTWTEAIEGVGQEWENLKNNTSTNLDSIKYFNKSAWEDIKNTTSKTIDSIALDYVNTEQKIKQSTNNIKTETKGMFKHIDFIKLYEGFNKAFGGATKGAGQSKEALKKVKEEMKKLGQWVNNTMGSLNSGLKEQISKYDKVKQKLIDIRDQYKKWKEEAHNTILEINHGLASLDQEKNNKLAERYVAIQKQLQELEKSKQEIQKQATEEQKKQQEKIIELQNKLQVLLQRQAEFTNKTKESTKISIQQQIESIRQKIEALKQENYDNQRLIEITNQRKQLEQELQIIQAKTPEEILKQAEAYNKLNETQKILLETEKQKQKLLEQKAIYEAIEGQKGLLDEVIKVKETDGQLTAQYFDKQKQQWVEITDWENIQLAVRLENKRNALLQETQDQIQALDTIRQATETQTQQMLNIWTQYHNQLKIKTANTTANLLAQYERIKKSLREIIALRARAGQSKGYHMGGLVKGFATGGYTGGNTPLKPAGIVHQGEYVIPKWMTDTYRGLIQNLEQIRTNGIVNNTKNVNVQFGEVVVNKEVDFDKLSYDLQWRLGFL